MQNIEEYQDDDDDDDYDENKDEDLLNEVNDANQNDRFGKRSSKRLGRADLPE